MKTRLRNNDEVAHVWAQQKQERGRASTMFFEGRSIYSYGRHFEIARFVTPEIVLFTDRTYSVTTRQHIGRASRAVSHKTTFTVPSFEDHSANARFLASEVRKEIDGVNRSTASFKWRLKYLDDKIADAYSYLEAFKKKIDGAARKEIRAIDAYRAKVLSPERMAEKEKRFAINAAKQAEREKNAAALRLIRQEKRNAELAQVIEQWKRGEINSCPWDYTGAVVLRVKDDRIETSRGADIPLIAARKLWRRFLKNPAALSGLSLGAYTVDRVETFDPMFGTDASGNLIVGCHRIPFSELYRMADLLGWRNGVPFEASEVLQ